MPFSLSLCVRSSILSAPLPATLLSTFYSSPPPLQHTYTPSVQQPVVAYGFTHCRPTSTPPPTFSPLVPFFSLLCFLPSILLLPTIPGVHNTKRTPSLTPRPISVKPFLFFFCYPTPFFFLLRSLTRYPTASLHEQPRSPPPLTPLFYSLPPCALFFGETDLWTTGRKKKMRPNAGHLGFPAKKRKVNCNSI